MRELLPRGNVRDAFRVVWLVRSRVIRGDLNFWLVVIGYDPRSRSFNNQIYLVYALIFFAVWIFMVLTLLADIAARFLMRLGFATPQSAAVGVGSLVMAGLFLLELFQATRRSPFVFSDADAHLLSHTPVDRRPVALIWMLQAWVERGLGVAAGAVVLGYALLQAQSPRALTPADLPAYLVAGGRMALVAAPLYLALLSLTWAAGAWRLRGRREPANLRWIAPGLLLALAGGAAARGLEGLIIWLAPLTFPIRAGLGLAPWFWGLGFSVLLAIVAGILLWRAAEGMSLTRAALETRDREAIQSARMTGQFDRLGELTLRSRLPAQHAPSRIPARAAAWALVWKNAVQDQRRFNVLEMAPWVGIAGLALVMIVYEGFGARFWCVIALTLLVSARAVAPLRRNLGRWWLLRQLPFTSERMLAAMFIPPVVGAWLAGAAGLLAAALLRIATPGIPGVPGIGIWLYLALAPSVGLTAVIDILRKSQSGDLLVGRVPDVTIVSLLLAGGVIAVDGGFAWLLTASLGLSTAASLPWVAAESLGLLLALWKSAAERLRRVK